MRLVNYIRSVFSWAPIHQIALVWISSTLRSEKVCNNSEGAKCRFKMIVLCVSAHKTDDPLTRMRSWWLRNSVVLIIVTTFYGKGRFILILCIRFRFLRSITFSRTWEGSRSMHLLLQRLLRIVINEIPGRNYTFIRHHISYRVEYVVFSSARFLYK